MDRTFIEQKIKDISEHQEYLDRNVENLDFVMKRHSGDREVHLALSELSCIVGYQQEIIKQLVKAIILHPEEQEIHKKLVELRKTFEDFDENQKDHNETRRDFLFSYLYTLGRLNREDEQRMQNIDEMKRRNHGK
tara:strand:- start:107 stop:511 length:405 start_codon:yes stop_codon:yes gene_type:complete